jgi:hypothetical protein
MAQVKTNDVVVCINDSNIKSLPIKKGLKYVINDVRTCPTCGMIEYKLSIPYTGFNLACVACNTPFEKELTDTWWSEHWRFALLEEQSKENKEHKVKLEPKKIVREFDILAN